jgi:hypothetical protein
LLHLGAVSVAALALGFLEDDFEDWGGCGADSVLLRGFETCENLLLLASGLRPRARYSVREDGIDGIFGLVWHGTGTGSILCVVGVDSGVSEGTVAVLPQQPIGRLEASDDDEA